ncbi:hypothetical protein DFH28DRAFT_943383 [Melampsora americana]|nr:hypothetical protein DFH28DRAFT_943383 [Melampsora americana]
MTLSVENHSGTVQSDSEALKPRTTEIDPQLPTTTFDQHSASSPHLTKTNHINPNSSSSSNITHISPSHLTPRTSQTHLADRQSSDIHISTSDSGADPDQSPDTFNNLKSDPTKFQQAVRGLSTPPSSAHIDSLESEHSKLDAISATNQSNSNVKNQETTSVPSLPSVEEISQKSLQTHLSPDSHRVPEHSSSISEQETPKPKARSPRQPSLARLSTGTSPHWAGSPATQTDTKLRTPPNALNDNETTTLERSSSGAINSQPPPSKGWSAVKAKLITNSSPTGPSQHNSRQRTRSETGLPSSVISFIKSKPKTTEVKTQVVGTELTTELTTGLLPVIMLKMAMDRDEHGQHRIPILMNYLKLKVTDSIHPFHASHAVFRIELEYGDRLLKWVIYRELRDFVNLHAAYKASNIVSRNSSDVSLPPFPKTSLPYYNLLKREGKAENKGDFARLQREGLEDYLIKLTKATMFVPEANRLCKFLEISALSLALANRGGFQGKQGYLRIMSSGAFSRRKRAGFHPMEWKERREPKWFIVRESYLICVDEPDQTEIYDIFLLDDEFQLQRPTRLLKQGIHLIDWHDARKQQHSPPTPPSSYLASAEQNKSKGKNKNKTKRRSMSVPTRRSTESDPNDPSATDLLGADPKHQNASSHVFYIINSEREVKLTAKNERQMDQFIASIERMAARSIWSGKNRFDSYAPIRMNVSAQWLIDGRDYFWNLSKAILLAKERIYIHDWWLSPELYLRRPPALNQKWRLDRLLQRKANEGVQIFVIVYKEVSNGFTPVESGYTKSRLLSLSPNIHIQRSPSHTGTGNLLWSHHEKLCVIDETIAFMGGLDLCFGRWDSPGHVLIDDATGGLDFVENFDRQTHDVEDGQIWPGKDYSNQRVSDFFNLSRPEEDMYDRVRVPRQPWHDIGLQLVGQPARDLCRHFIQRWNYLLRTKNHTRLMPFLIPPSDFTPLELSERRIIGTCEAQICRSCGPWSIGTPSKIEHSIQTAYVKAIELSDHFVYIENQFFITSCIVEGTVITNQIGDALVNRIIKAHTQGTPWKAIIIIPTMPGYPSPLNEDAAGSVRLIVECQNRSICRGETSIFSRLRVEGIDPNDYITFFSLRGWGKLKNGQLTTEGVYIHAKAMIVDDRLVIIGSANINERSQRGDRDSELACVVRDTDMIDGTMAGKPYKVSRFAHTMRIRLMREHLGVDVDALEAEEANMELMEHQNQVHEERMKEKARVELHLPLTRPSAKTSTSMLGSGMWDPDRQQRQESDAREGVTHLVSHRTRAADAIKSLGNDLKDRLAIHRGDGGTDIGGEGAEGPTPNSNRQTTKKLVTEQADKNPSVAEGKDQSTADDDQGNDGEQPTSKLVATLEEKIANETPTASASSARDPRSQGLLHPTGAAGREQVNSEPKYLKDRASNISFASDGEPNASSSNQHQSSDTLTTRARGPSVSISEHHTSSYDRTDVSSPQPDSNHQTPQLSQSHSPSIFNASHQSHINHDFLNSPPIAPSRHLSKRVKGAVNLSQFTISVPPVEIDPNGFEDPLADSFFKSVWLTIASRNTQILRKVFRCVPDDNVKTWQNYKEYQAWENRHTKPVRDRSSSVTEKMGGSDEGNGNNGGMNPSVISTDGTSQRTEQAHQHQERTREPSGFSGTSTLSQTDRYTTSDGSNIKTPISGSEFPTHSELNPHSSIITNHTNKPRKKSISKAEKKANLEEGFTQLERDQMEEFLKEVQGHLVLFPTRFMESEDLNNNFLFQKDRIPPLAIYN